MLWCRSNRQPTAAFDDIIMACSSQWSTYLYSCSTHAHAPRAALVTSERSPSRLQLELPVLPSLVRPRRRAGPPPAVQIVLARATVRRARHPRRDATCTPTPPLHDNINYKFTDTTVLRQVTRRSALQRIHGDAAASAHVGRGCASVRCTYTSDSTASLYCCSTVLSVPDLSGSASPHGALPSGS